METVTVATQVAKESAQVEKKVFKVTTARNLGKAFRPPTVRVTKAHPEGAVNPLDMQRVGPFATFHRDGKVEYNFADRQIDTTGSYGTKSTFAVRAEIGKAGLWHGPKSTGKKRGCRLIANSDLVRDRWVNETFIEAYRGGLVLVRFNLVSRKDLVALEGLCQNHFGTGFEKWATMQENRAKSIAGRGFRTLDRNKIKRTLRLIKASLGR